MRPFLRTTSFLAAALAAVAPLAAQVERPEQLQFQPLRAFAIPKPTVATLDNGLVVMLLEDHELPTIEARLLVRAGSLAEPAEKAGLAGIVGQVLRSGGAGARTGDELDEFLEVRAAAIESSIGDASGTVRMDCLAPDFDAVFAAFAEVVRAPAFAQDKIDLAKVQAKSGIARRNDDVGAIATREYRRAVYGVDSPMVRQVEYATIDAIEREDLVAFHAASFHPNAMVLGLVGDFETKAMLAKVRKVFGAWPKGPAIAPLTATPTAKPGGRVLSVTKTDVNQAQVRLGHLGITFTSPDYFTVEVLNEVLGGGFSGRLLQNIRSNKGLAYAVGGGVGAGFAYPGLTTFQVSTKFSTTAAAVDALREEIEAMRAAPPTADEIARAKDSILSGFVFNYASMEQVLAQRMAYRFWGLPDDWLEQYQGRIEKVTAEEVHQAALARLRPEELVLLVAGDPAQYDRELASFGPVEEVDITISVPVAKAEAIEDSAAARTAGRAVLDRVVAAMGGPNPHEVAAISSEATLTLSMGGQELSLARTSLSVFPDRLREVVRTPMGEQIKVVAGDHGWLEMGGQRRELPPEALAQHRLELGRDLRTIVRYANEPGVEAIAVGSEKVGALDYDKLVVRYLGAESTLLVAADGTVAFQRYAGTNPLTGAPGAVEVELLDYRDVAGRKVPHNLVIRIDGEPAARSALSRFEVDPVVDETLFAAAP